MNLIRRLALTWSTLLMFAATAPHALPRDALTYEQKKQLDGMLAARQFAKLEAHFERWQRRYKPEVIRLCAARPTPPAFATNRGAARAELEGVPQVCGSASIALPARRQSPSMRACVAVAPWSASRSDLKAVRLGRSSQVALAAKCRPRCPGKRSDR